MVKNITIQEGIQNVVDGKIDIFKNSRSNPFELLQILNSLEEGSNEILNSDSNGWEGDVWYEVKFQNNKYTVEGSGYTGGVKFYKSDESDDE